MSCSAKLSTCGHKPDMSEPQEWGGGGGDKPGMSEPRVAGVGGERQT